MAKLTPRQARFVSEYLLDLNATQAAIRSGYSEKTANVQGPRLLVNVRVAEAIAQAKADRLQRVEITQDEVIRELRSLAFSDHTHFQVDDAGSVTLAPGAPETAHRSVSSIKRRIMSDAEGFVTREVEIKLWDKPSMLKLAGRHVGAKGFADRVELTGADGGPVRTQAVDNMTTDEKRAELARLLAEGGGAESEPPPAKPPGD